MKYFKDEIYVMQTLEFVLSLAFFSYFWGVFFKDFPPIPKSPHFDSIQRDLQTTEQINFSIALLFCLFQTEVRFTKKPTK